MKKLTLLKMVKIFQMIIKNGKNISNDTELCNILMAISFLMLFPNLAFLKSIIVF